jgi:hypothetical protein
VLLLLLLLRLMFVWSASMRACALTCTHARLPVCIIRLHGSLSSTNARIVNGSTVITNAEQLINYQMDRALQCVGVVSKSQLLSILADKRREGTCSEKVCVPTVSQIEECSCAERKLCGFPCRQQATAQVSTRRGSD